jgi:hypothetical protein
MATYCNNRRGSRAIVDAVADRARRGSVDAAPDRARRARLHSAWIFATLGVAAFLGGCSPYDPFDRPFDPYEQRIVTVSPTAGNSVAANEAIQTIDPWPPYVYNTRSPGDGSRMVRAVQSYETGPKEGGVSPAQAAALGGIGATAGVTSGAGGGGGGGY